VTPDDLVTPDDQVTPDDLVIRPLAGAQELELFRGLTYCLDDELADDMAEGRRRPERMWVALRGGRLEARAAWWGGATDAAPSLLDFLDVGDAPDRVAIGGSLLRATLRAALALGEIGPPPREYIRFVPPDWRAQPGSRREIEDLMAIVSATGAHLLAERYRFEWRPGAPVPEPTGRLIFRPVSSDREVIDLMTLAMDGTLDAHGRRDLATMPAREAAARQYHDELGRYRSPRRWWQIASLPAGEPVGFVFPARNDYGAIMAYLGVLPAHRGHGYIDEILAAGTRTLAGQEVPRIRASTDLGNVPMAAAFARAGWVNFENSINMVWD
jgi:RimJ/RimL family protein N-acetyltransferase